jgi:AcrR family transcriptional regulator
MAQSRRASPVRTGRADPELSPPVPPKAGARQPADSREPISRGDGARRRVLQAALEVLDEDGLPGFTMEAVARRAGASKATLYRRWPTVGSLLIDAMDATFQPLPVPDTGHVATDVTQLITAFVALLEHTKFPRLLAAFIDAAERDRALAGLHAELTKRRREPLLLVLTRGRERGQLPADLNLEVVTDLLAGPFFYRRFIAHQPIPTDLADQVVAHVLTSRSPPIDDHAAVRSTRLGASARTGRRAHRRSPG